MTKIQDSYGEWLSQYDWSYWVTFTTRYTLTLPSGRRLMERFWNHTDFKRTGKARLFWCAEPFDLREGYHLHGLLKCNEIITIKMIAQIHNYACGNVECRKDQWHRIQIKRYDNKLGAGYYVGKYITKRLSDYDMLERF